MCPNKGMLVGIILGTVVIVLMPSAAFSSCPPRVDNLHEDQDVIDFAEKLYNDSNSGTKNRFENAGDVFVCKNYLPSGAPDWNLEFVPHEFNPNELQVAFRAQCAEYKQNNPDTTISDCRANILTNNGKYPDFVAGYKPSPPKSDCIHVGTIHTHIYEYKVTDSKGKPSYWFSETINKGKSNEEVLTYPLDPLNHSWGDKDAARDSKIENMIVFENKDGKLEVKPYFGAENPALKGKTFECQPSNFEWAKQKLSGWVYGQVHGDPHYRDFDGRAFDNQDVGEYLLFKNQSVEIHVRTDHPCNADGVCRKKVSVVKTASISVQGHKIHMTKGDGKPFEILVDDEHVTMEEDEIISISDSLALYRDRANYRLTLKDLTSVKITPKDNHLNIKVGIPKDTTDSPKGLLAFTGQSYYTSRNGKAIGVVEATLLELTEFTDSWRVTDEESLLPYEPGETTSDYSVLEPSVPVNFDDYNELDRYNAKQTCLDAGHTNSYAIYTCMLDLLVTEGNTDFTVYYDEDVVPLVYPSTLINEPEGWYFVGSAYELVERAYLVGEKAGTRSGAAFFGKPINLNEAFQVSTKAYFGESTRQGGGMVFGLFAGIPQEISDSGSSGLGFESLCSGCVGVEIDNYQNGGQNDTSGQHLGIVQNGSVLHSEDLPAIAISDTVLDLEDGKEHTVSFSWNPASKQISLTIDNSVTHSITHQADIVKEYFGGNVSAYFGITGSRNNRGGIKYFMTPDL